MIEPRQFDERTREIALALARAIIPAGAKFAGADFETIDRAERLLGSFGVWPARGYEALLRLVDLGSRAAYRRPITELSHPEILSLLGRWMDGARLGSAVALAAATPLKVARFDDPEVFHALGATHVFDHPGSNGELPPGVTKGEEIAGELQIECDAVVVGTGAGGAVVAKELTDQGHSVIMLEEGEYVTSSTFRGRPIESLRRLYRDRGVTGSVGNTIIPIPMGRLVGGSTAVNTGTCWRTPEWILDRWAREGLTNLSPQRMEPYFEKVERFIPVAPASPDQLGGVARVIARGSDALGLSHRALMRNAPGCKGSGVCNFGCPTDAKRGTNLTYVPEALRGGARLFTGVMAERIEIEGGRAVGVEGVSVSTGARLSVRARAVVLACGTLLDPLMLRQQGIGTRLGMLGRNLSIHPAAGVSALFDEEIRGYTAIPQGWCVDEFHRDGILAMGASVPIDIGSSQFAFVGRKLTEVMEAYDRVATFGVMVSDASRGRVLNGPGGRPLTLYWLGRRERRRLIRGVQMVARIFLEAGAREVYPAVRGHRIVRNNKDVEQIGDQLPRAADFLLTAFHPLGTCRMATSPERGVVSPSFEVFGVPGLYVADGSVVPSSPAVNPQLTIMALATMAAESISEQLGAS